ncbi:MAG: pseudouridine-5-phosphate glycosidase [Actinomycetia bacterium]|nr:pseudouridine-5-phosphate glycosidase [Actinomycetes bacterium]
MTAFRVAAAVADALADGRPVVALESTVFSALGLPAPSGAEALTRCLAAVRAGGAEPAVTAVLDGVARIGLEPDEHERILTCASKVAERDLPFAVGSRWTCGVTTVSASLRLAALAGIGVFATGGIGGVHRDVEHSGDVSADLGAIAHHPVVTVSAGAKVFLDLARTLEHLETIGVPVVALGYDEFPAFTTRSSGLPAPRRVDTVEQVAAVVRAARGLGYDGGLLLAVPVPEADEVPRDVLDRAIATAHAAAAVAGVTGPAVTPYVLGQIADATGGASVPANLALAERNALVAGQLAAALVATS